MNQIVDFIYETQLETIPTFYYDAFLNYLGVTYIGAKEDPISMTVHTLLEEYTGKYQMIYQLYHDDIEDIYQFISKYSYKTY